MKDRLILYKGLVYVPNNENLKRKVVQQYHDGIMGHPGEWKTIELITRDFWWPGITTFIKAYIKGCGGSVAAAQADVFHKMVITI